MPVQKQLVTVSVAGGLDTKTDPKQVAQGKLVALENAVCASGAVKKRNGFGFVTNGETSDFRGGVAMSTYEDELLAFDGSRAWSVTPSNHNWVDRGDVDSCLVGGRAILRTSADQQLNPDVARVSGIEMYAWEDSRGGVRIAILDATTGAYYASDQLIDAAATLPKVLVLAGIFVVLYYVPGSTALRCVQINPANTAVVIGPTTLLSDGHGTAFGYDAAVFTGAASGTGSDGLFVGYMSSASTASVKLLSFTGGLAAVASVVVTTGATAHASGTLSPFAVAPSASGTARVGIVWSTGAQARAAAYPYALGAAFIAHAQIDSTAAITALTMVDTGASQWTSRHEVKGSPTSNTLVNAGTMAQSGSPVTFSGVFARSVGLASKLFVEGGRACVVLTHESPLQPTYFVMRSDGPQFTTQTFAKALPGVGGGLRSNGLLSEAVMAAPSQWLFAVSAKGRTTSEANTLFSLLGVNSLTLDFEHSDRFLSTTQTRCLLTVGGILQSYDGVSFVEQGFHLDPEGLAVTATGSDGHLGSGTYQYCACYEWSDNNGQIQRSSPSVPVSVSGAASNHGSVVVPTLRVTKKTARTRMPRGEVSIVIYRTTANGLLFYRCSSTLAPLLNDTTVDSLTFVDLASDADIQSNELLYTTGGVLGNAAPPACSLVVAYQGRVAVAGLEDPNLIWFSKNRFDNTNFNTIPAEFSASLTIGVDARGGAITALGVLDDKLVVFKARSIFALAGQGPNDTGGDSDYGDPQLITTDCGCMAPDSVVSTPMGLMFQTSKGIYLLDRSLAVSYIGAPVEAYNANTVLSSVLHPSANEALFLLDDEASTILVYDYVYAQWSTWAISLDHGGTVVDLDVSDGLATYLLSSGWMSKETPGVYTDDVIDVIGDVAQIPFAVSLALPAFSFAGLSGFQRAFRAFLLGEYGGAHSLTVKVLYDFSEDDSGASTAVVTPQPTDAPYQYRIDFSRQRCTAVQLKIAETSPTGNAFTLSSVAFEIGVLPGGNRPPRTQIVGAS